MHEDVLQPMCLPIEFHLYEFHTTYVVGLDTLYVQYSNYLSLIK
jgi:hypothetical protein